MSAAHRFEDGLARQRQEEAAAGWGSGHYPMEAGRNWAGGGEMGGVTGAQNSPYPGYDPSGWSCSGHPRPPYPPNYPVGAQGMEPYANGSYGAPYNQSSMNPSYPGFHPAYPYFPPPPQVPYSQWGYPEQGCPNIPQQSPQFPQYPAQQAMPQPTPPDESWNMYGGPNPYQWHTAPPPQHHPQSRRAPWAGGEVQPAVYDVKDASQAANYNNQRPVQGYPSDISQPGPPPEPKPQPPPTNPHYSASPQMYNRKQDPPKQEPRPQEYYSTPSDSSRTLPGIVKINQILETVSELETEVDEFVGKKTEMSYRCLEEMLTKQLLELDSVETGGQESVRLARKDAVRRLQFILERLERKGL